MLGSNLACYFRDKYEVLGLYNSHPVSIAGVRTAGCDQLLPGNLENALSGFRPGVVIHCASLADIERCEADRELARRINVDAVRDIVECAALGDAFVVYPSTDAVYDGVKGNFREDDPVSPRNYYGRSKYEGERVLAGRANTLVLRTNMFGWNIRDKTSLGEWILGRLRAGETIDGFTDACFSTMYTMEMARVLDVAIGAGLSGIYNCGATDCMSKHEFALLIAERFGLDASLVVAGSMRDSELTVERGRDLSLDSGALSAALGYRMPSIEESVDSFYRDARCGFRRRLREKMVRAEPELIRYGGQSIDEGDIMAVCDVLRSPFLTQGPNVDAFERAVAGFCGAKYAVAASSGTAALHIACLAAGLDEGDESITSPNTFVASANCAVYCGARPVFADIDPVTYNIDARQIAGKIGDATKAVIPVHFAGQSCDMSTIRDVVDSAEERLGHKIYVIEDASHALGSEYGGHRVGSCRHCDMTVLSFHPVKHITTGEGGMVLTNDEQLWRKLRRFRSHGITNTADELEAEAPGRWYYEQQDLGCNYRITDIQCALGRSQMRRLPEFMGRRHEIVEAYNAAFSGIDNLRTPVELAECTTNFHLYVLRIDFTGVGMTRSEFMDALMARGIQTQVHYIPVHTQPFFRRRYNTDWGDCPRAEGYYRSCLSIPLHPAMSERDVRVVIEAITSIVGE